MDAPVPLVKQLIESVVNLHTTVPRDHPSASVLGEERMGSGVIVDDAGLILTVNYVVMGAQTVQVEQQQVHVAVHQNALRLGEDFVWYSAQVNVELPKGLLGGLQTRSSTPRTGS